MQDEVFAIADSLYGRQTLMLCFYQESLLCGSLELDRTCQEAVLSSIPMFYCLTLKEAYAVDALSTFNGTVPREGRPMCAVVQCACGVWGRPETQPPSTARASSRDHHTIQDQRRGHGRVCQRTLPMRPLGAAA
jgi:hypothetical protein